MTAGGAVILFNASTCKSKGCNFVHKSGEQMTSQCANPKQILNHQLILTIFNDDDMTLSPYLRTAESFVFVVVLGMVSKSVDADSGTGHRGQCETTRMLEAFLDRCHASESCEALLL